MNRLSRWFLVAGFVLIILGAKLWLVDFAGTDLPVLDQWDGEAESTLRPWAEGRLTFHDLIQPHNEHRLVTTKLYALALAAANGQWDGFVETTGNAVIHAACAVLLLFLGCRWLRRRNLAALVVLLLLAFSLPFSWENTLVGFQVQFYFLLLFSLLQLALTLGSDRFSWRWGLGVLCGGLGVVTMASGFLSSAAVLAVLGARGLRERRWTAQQLVTAAVCAICIVAGSLLVYPVSGHAVLKAHSAGQFAAMLLRGLAWPNPGGGPWLIVPALWFVVQSFRRRETGGDNAVLLGVLGWDVLQCMALAYGRGAAGEFAPRYLDLLALNVPLGFVFIGREWTGGFRRFALAGWFLAAAFGLVRLSIAQWHSGVVPLAGFRLREEAAVRDFVRTGDPRPLKNKTWPAIPYPDATVLIRRLQPPSIRRLLPPSVRAPVPVARGTPGELPAGLEPPPLPLAVSTYSSPGAFAWRSAVQPATTLPALRFVVAGDLGRPGAQIHLVVHSATGETPVVPDRAPGRRWKGVTVFRPPGPWWIEATGNDPHAWFAFTEPVEVGRLTWLAQKLLKHHLVILLAGALLLLAGAGWRALGKLRAVRTGPRDRRAALSAAAVIVLGAALVTPLCARMHWAGAGRHPPAAPAPAGPGLVLATTASLGRFAGAVAGPAANDRSWLGTYVHGDGFTGRVQTGSFPLGSGALAVPILGYPNRDGNALTLEILDARDRVIATLRYQGPDPHEQPGRWTVRVDPWIGRRGRLVLEDRSQGLGGWLAVGPPWSVRPHGAAWLAGVPRNYAWFAAAAAALVALLFLPGLALRTWLPRHMPSGAAWLAVPGLLLLPGWTLFLAVAHLHDPGPAVLCWLLLHGCVAVALAGAWWREGGPLPAAEMRALGCYACVVVAALAYAVLPLPVAHEYMARTTSASRMIASPPDSTIPYRTAAYFFHRKDGHQDRVAYFGQDWSVASRGPLAPLAIVTAFVLFHEQPADPPGSALDAWPAAADGFYLARIVGILTNALVLLAGAALAAALGGPAAGRLALCWLAVAPVIVVNTDFIWPKLLAAFFVCLAVAEAWASRPPWRTAGWIALAYFSHPVGGLCAPVLLVAVGVIRASAPGLAPGRRLTGALRAAGGCALALLAWLFPWLAFKWWVAFPDHMLRYPLGDGHGFAVAASLGSWLRCRLDNLWFTLVPGAFYFSNVMRTWLGGPVGELLRWAIGYAKSLPGSLGLAMFVVAVAAILRRPATAALARFRGLLLAGTGGVMLLFWGFSSDGLGRNCLEPFAVLLIVYAAAATPVPPRCTRWLLVLTALESLSVRAIGLWSAPNETLLARDFETALLAGLAAAGTLAPALWHALGPPAADSRPASSPPAT